LKTGGSAEPPINNKEKEMIDAKHMLKDHAYQNIPLNFEEAYALGRYALLGCDGDKLAQIQSVAIMSALHSRATYAYKAKENDAVRHGHKLPESAAEQIAGVCAAILEHDVSLSPLGFVCPSVPFAIDNCGMGGDMVVTANVSSIAALIAASAGINMCKHGSPANADNGRHGSSDFMSLLGIDPFVPKETMESCIESEHFGYIEALDTRYKRIHLQTHEVAKLPHMNDIIGPLTSPLSPAVLTRQVVGINHLIPPRIVAEACAILNRRSLSRLEYAFFVRGFADEECRFGMDEVSICPGGTQVISFRNGLIQEFRLDASDFGLQTVPAASISPPVGMSKGEFSLKILRGEIQGPPLDMVLANAAILFVLADVADNFREGCDIARDIHARGLAYEKVDDIKGLLYAGLS
jgi:anthranilate phosphoribosyltransferase